MLVIVEARLAAILDLIERLLWVDVKLMQLSFSLFKLRIKGETSFY